jgi:hypothetical protein
MEHKVGEPSHYPIHLFYFFYLVILVYFHLPYHQNIEGIAKAYP